MLFRRRTVECLYFMALTAVLLWIVTSLVWNRGLWCGVEEHRPSRNAFDGDRERRLYGLEERLRKYSRDLKRAEKLLRLEYPRRFAPVFRVSPNALPTIYAVTPTHTRSVQKAELTRLSQTFLHVKHFHWIVVEDSLTKTKLVQNFLLRSGLQYTHLNIITPPDFKMKSTDPNWLKPRGVLQRNLALQWIRAHVDSSRKGVVYFADDDNTYDLSLFDEMRFTRKVSVWPVGLVGALRFERPLVEEGKVVGWYTYWKPKRPFAMDMAGFAVNLTLILNHPDANFDLIVPRGYQESSFLTQLVTLGDLEPKAENCSKVLVWHTRTETAKLKNELRLQARGLSGSDLTVEV